MKCELATFFEKPRAQRPMTPSPTQANNEAATRPSGSLFANFRQELAGHPPFAQMSAPDVDFFLSYATQQYFAPEETLLAPSDGVVKQLYFVRSGAVTGTRGLAEHMGGAFEYEAGDLFPVGAALAERAVTATYQASADTFVLCLPVQRMRELALRSTAFAEFLQLRTAKYLALSRQALQSEYSANAIAEHSLEKKLSEVNTVTPITCAPNTPLRSALETMHQKRIGSMLITDPAGVPVGILTRYDVLGRILLAQVPLDAPISQVMVQPVLSLTTEHSAQDAALLMSKHGVRHVPITQGGVAVGMVSERDLFALQKRSLKNVSSGIRAATDVEALKRSAQEIRGLAQNLLGQGVQARQLTALISHMNDVLTERLLKLKADEHGIDLSHLCWLSLGSEGRDEQTIATDQDNALILPNDIDPTTRQTVRDFAHEVNLALDACGYPLCHGGIMAGEPACCLTLDEWRERFRQWITQGSPQDLLNASIYFDFRALCGDAQLAATLRREVVGLAQHTPRFLKQLAQNALTRSVPLNWRGAIDTDDNDSIDLKLQGTAIIVDAARIYALAHGVDENNTRKRLEAVGSLLHLPNTEYDAWVGGFEFLQMLRLRMQLEDRALPEQPNRVRVTDLNSIDRKVLRESFRMARQLQQRLQLDYVR